MGLFNLRVSRIERSGYRNQIIRETLVHEFSTYDAMLDKESIGDAERIEIRKQLLTQCKKNIKGATNYADFVALLDYRFEKINKKYEIVKKKEHDRLERFLEKKRIAFIKDFIDLYCEEYDLKFLKSVLQYIFLSKDGFEEFQSIMQQANLDKSHEFFRIVKNMKVSNYGNILSDKTSERELKTSSEAVVQVNVTKDPTESLGTSEGVDVLVEKDESADKQPLIADETIDEEVEVVENEEEEQEELFDRLLNS